MLKMLFLLVSQAGFGPLFADCGCLCVDGMAKTLCKSISEAQLQPNACPANQQCPVPPVPENTDPPVFFDAPAEQAHHCREVRVWDKAASAYTGVKVCDVYTS